MHKGRVVVAMSGGVDSSVTAALLKEAGYQVIGVMMRLWSEAGSTVHLRTCCSLDAAEDARRVCQVLDIPFYYLNFEQRFKTCVVDYFCSEYSRGRTPNPCLVCNQKIKFHFLLQEALALGADHLATGHYARIELRDGKCRLLRGIDQDKDQSYFLYTLGQGELQHLLFPLGGYLKSQTREMAARWGLPTAFRAESQEICFIPDDYRGFLAQWLSPKPGPIVDTGGRVLGRHQGIAFYTVGQRRGLGLTSREPLYVKDIQPDTNTLVVGSNDQLFGRGLIARQLSYVSGEIPGEPLIITAKVRYKSPEAGAVLLPRGKEAEVRFEEPQRAITPGQAVVFYQGEVVLGGGIIEAATD